MNGAALALGAMGALAIGAAVGRRGSRAKRPASTQELPLDLPAVLYHGSSRSDLVTLAPSRSGALGPGIYLATEPEEGLRWAGWRGRIPDHAPTVYRVHAEIHRPYLWRSDDGAQHPDRVNERVRREGYDAIVRRTMDGSIPELIVFDPAQIVSMEPASGATLGRRGSRATDPTSTLAFRRWFGESKVVDGAGRPQVVYHGTSRAFDRFGPKEIGKHFKHSRGGFFFLGDVEQAWGYADASEVEQGGTPRVIAAYLSLEHPLVLESGEEEWPEAHFDENIASILRRARRGGHDGVIVHGIDPYSDNEPRSVYIAFRPTQIKAIDNVGTFDPSDPRINYNRSPR